MEELEDITYLTLWRMSYRRSKINAPTKSEKKALVRMATQADMDRL